MARRIIVFLLAAVIPLTVFDRSASVCRGTGRVCNFTFRGPVQVHPRCAAMGQATTALRGGSEGIFDNPASLAMMNSAFDVALARYSWIADIYFYQGTLALRPGGGRFGTTGFSFWREDFGSIEGTLLGEREHLYYESFGLAYALSPIPSLNLGGHARYMDVNISAETEPFNDIDDNYILFDLGLSYQTGLKSLILGLVYRNYWRYYEVQERVHLIEAGVSMDLLDLIPQNLHRHSLIIALDQVIPHEDNRVFEIGAEYSFNEIVFIRTGLRGPVDLPEHNYGVGLSIPLGRVNLQVDYTRGDMEYFGAIERFAVQVSY